MKINYRRGTESGGVSWEEGAAARRWNRVCAALVVVFVLAASAGAGSGTGMDFGSPDPAGFALWFLYCCACPMLWLLELLRRVSGVQNSETLRLLAEHQVLGCLVLDLLSVSLLWILLRWRGLRWLGADRMRVAANFMGILLGWGVLQLLCWGVAAVWTGGGDPRPLRIRCGQEEHRCSVPDPAGPRGADSRRAGGGVSAGE